MYKYSFIHFLTSALDSDEWVLILLVVFGRFVDRLLTLHQLQNIFSVDWDGRCYERRNRKSGGGKSRGSLKVA